MWDRCPFGELRDPLWRAAVWLASVAEVSPLTGLDTQYSAGIAMAIISLRGAQAERRRQIQQEELEALRRRGG